MRAFATAFSGHVAAWRRDRTSRSILSGMMTIGILTLAVKVIAFGKDLVVADRLGTSDALDAFLIAFMIPSFVAQVLGTAFADAILPAYTDENLNRDRRAANVLAANTVWISGAILLLVTALLYLGGSHLVPLLSARFSPEKSELTVRFFYLLLPFTIFYGLSLVFTILLQAHKRFALAAFAPALVPIVTIAALLLAYDRLGIHALIYGVLTGSCLHALLLHTGLRSAGFRGMLQPRGWNPATRAVLRQTGPLIASGVVVSGAVLVDSAMAAWLEPGSVAVLGYASKICSIILALAATSASQAIFPFLSEQVSRKDWQALQATIFRFSALTLILSIPVVFALWLFTPSIVATLFERGEFTAHDTERVAGVLSLLGMQIPFYILAVLAARVVIALRAVRFMLVTTIINLAANVFLNYLFMQYLGLRGIALSTVVVYLLSALMLYSFIVFTIRREKTVHRKGGSSA